MQSTMTGVAGGAATMMQIVSPTMFGNMSMHAIAKSHLTKEREIDQAEHIRRGQQRRQNADDPQDLMPVVEGLEEDFVLREEAGQTGDAGDCQRSDQERPEGDRQGILQPAHAADVLFTVQRMDDGARPEEQ